MIQIKNLTVAYGKQPALQDINLLVPRGECLLITGPSGCGKSTLARVLSGLIPHALHSTMSGQVQVAGMDVRQHSVAALACCIGTVFQNPSTHLFHLRLDDEVAFGLRNLGLPEETVHERVVWALDAVGLDGMEAQKPMELSGGQKQRLAIACALAMQPDVLVLDEPTASLDVPGTRQVMRTLQKVREDLGLTIVLIEHRLAEAVRLADRVLILDQGRIVADGDPEEVLADRPMLRELGLRRPTDEAPVGWRRLLQPDGHSAQDGQPLVQLKGVNAGYDGHSILHNLELTLYPGEFVALVGNNGAGKSTLALLAAGLLKPEKGELHFAGGGKPRGGQDVALLFQNPADQLLTDRVDAEVALGPRNFNCFDEEQHLHTLQETDLLEFRQRRPTSLSAGQQQRTALAACLAMRPAMVILDEPTLGQDWGHMERLMVFLQRLNQRGTTILLITHDFKLVHRYARRVLLMQGGRIVMDGRLR